MNEMNLPSCCVQLQEIYSKIPSDLERIDQFKELWLQYDALVSEIRDKKLCSNFNSHSIIPASYDIGARIKRAMSTKVKTKRDFNSKNNDFQWAYDNLRMEMSLLISQMKCEKPMQNTPHPF